MAAATLPEPDNADLPLSPWATKFYPSAIPYRRVYKGFIHSGLAPKYPAYPPEYMSTWTQPGDDVVFAKPTDEDMDRLFLDERDQQGWFHGVRTWQLAAINSVHDGANPAGPMPPDPLDQTSPVWQTYWETLIIPRENGWFPWFNRSRWLDLRIDGVGSIRNPLPEVKDHPVPWWTVDNEAMWGYIAPCVEVSNRILKTMISSDNLWLHSLVFGTPFPWRHINMNMAAKHMTDSSFDPPLLLIQRSGRTRQELLQRMNQLLSIVIFTFEDETTGYDPSQEYAFCTMRHARVQMQAPQELPKYQPCITIALHVSYLKAFCCRDTTLAERANLQFHLGLTIVHELMHALWQSKNLEAGVALKGGRWPEPHMGGQVEAELGSSYETMVFGVNLKLAPCHPENPLIGLVDPAQGPRYARMNGSSAAMMAWTWPDEIKWSNEVLNCFPEKVMARMQLPVGALFPVPAVIAASVVSEDWWAEVVDTEGMRAFRIPKVLRTEWNIPWYHHGSRWYGARRTMGGQDVSAYWREPLKLVLERWEQRRQAWARMRPWHESEYYVWMRTPWSWAQARDFIDFFRDAHARRDLPKCIKWARALINVPPKTDGTTEKNPIGWLFAAIGHLMLASIPLMTENYSKTWGTKKYRVYPNSRGCSLLFRTGLTAPGAPNLAFGSIQHINMAADYFSNSIEEDRSQWPSPAQKLIDFINVFHPNARAHPMPAAWVRAVAAAANEIGISHKKTPTLAAIPANLWHPFSFSIPPYDPAPDQWVVAGPAPQSALSVMTGVPQLQFYPTFAPMTDDGRFVSPPSSPGRSLALLPDPDSKFYTAAYFKGAGGGGLLTTRHRATRMYFTVSEVANHVHSKKETWVIEPDDGYGFDVYDISVSCDEMGFSSSKDIRKRLLHMGQYGLSLRADGDKFAAVIRARLGSEIPSLGKMIIPKRLEEIAEYDGTNGMPVWIRVNTNVYDLSDVPNSERSALTRLKRGAGGSSQGLPTEIGQLNTILGVLEPYRRAVVMDQKRRHHQTTLRVFTKAMLRNYDSPSSGCYTSINGFVYDLSSYMEIHPGGSSILIRYLGREATEFHDWHNLELLDEYPNLLVGRIVPELTTHEVSKHQIAIHGWVFDISHLAPERSSRPEEGWIYTRVRQLGGTDASHAIIKDGSKTADALARLFLECKEYIVGWLHEDHELPLLPNKEVWKHNDPNAMRGAWTVVDGLVYDITSILLHRPYFEREIPLAWAGNNLTDQKLGSWLSQNYPNRVIGRLVEGPAWNEAGNSSRPHMETESEGNGEPGKSADRPDPVLVESIPEDILKWIADKGPSPKQIEKRLLDGIAAGTVKRLTPTHPPSLAPEGTEPLKGYKRKEQPAATHHHMLADVRQFKKARIPAGPARRVLRSEARQ